MSYRDMISHIVALSNDCHVNELEHHGYGEARGSSHEPVHVSVIMRANQVALFS